MLKFVSTLKKLTKATKSVKFLLTRISILIKKLKSFCAAFLATSKAVIIFKQVFLV